FVLVLCLALLRTGLGLGLGLGFGLGSVAAIPMPLELCIACQLLWERRVEVYLNARVALYTYLCNHCAFMCPRYTHVLICLLDCPVALSSMAFNWWPFLCPAHAPRPDPAHPCIIITL
ncbi:unnamed protein product, partial [Discosporangium mesarthrocarpum]